MHVDQSHGVNVPAKAGLALSDSTTGMAHIVAPVRAAFRRNSRRFNEFRSRGEAGASGSLELASVITPVFMSEPSQVIWTTEFCLTFKRRTLRRLSQIRYVD